MLPIHIPIPDKVDAGQCHHLPVDAGAGLRRWHGLCAVLLRRAAGHGAACRDNRAVLISSARLVGIRVSRAPLRQKDATADGLFVPFAARRWRRAFDLRAVVHLVFGAGLAAARVAGAAGHAAVPRERWDRALRPHAQ